MKTLILYATKHGATREVAERIASYIDGAVTHDLKSPDIPDLAAFDCVIIGSSIYAGAIRKEAKTFLSANSNELRGKKLGLFLCGLQENEAEKCFSENFSPEILQSAVAKSFLGGKFNPSNANAFERLAMKIVAKQKGVVNTVCTEKIKQFTESLKEVV